MKFLSAVLICCALLLSMELMGQNHDLTHHMEYEARGFVELSYAQYFAEDTLALIGLQFESISINLIHERFYFRLHALDLLFSPDKRLKDVMYGFGFGAAPFKSILYINLDLYLGYGIAAWNNFSGLIKPYIMLHLPIYRRKNKNWGINLTGAAGYYYRYAHKIFGWWGKDNIYARPKGYFIQGGIAVVLIGR